MASLTDTLRTPAPGTLPEINTFVMGSKPEGLTNLYAALEETFKDQKVDTVYLLSDGA